MLLPKGNCDCQVFDLDALYSSNADVIFGRLPPDTSERITLRVPPPGSDIEVEFSSLFASKPAILVIDSLNTLYHLLSSEDGIYRSRKLSFAVASLAYAARTTGGVVIMSMYRREGPPRTRTGVPMGSLSDVTVGVRLDGGMLRLKSERGIAWPGGEYSIRIP